MKQAFLTRSVGYRLFGWTIGAPRARSIFAREHIRSKPGDRLLDIGCGTGDLVRFLPAVEYHGFDSNPDYIRAARALHPAAHFSCERLADHVIDPKPFDTVIACGLLHHLDEAEALNALHIARDSLRSGGRLITLDGCYVPQQPALARFFLANDRGRHVRTLGGYVGLAERVFQRVTSCLRNDLLRVPYVHIVMECVSD